MEEQIIALCDAVCVSDKRYGLKIVGKPCEGKPHARFDEGLLGRQGRTSGLLYEPEQLCIYYELFIAVLRRMYLIILTFDFCCIFFLS